MSDSIKAGDLVMVVKPIHCCGSTELLGKIDYVADKPVSEYSRCMNCGTKVLSGNSVILSVGLACKISRLKKIPPLSELEDVTTHRQDLIPNEQEA